MGIITYKKTLIILLISLFYLSPLNASVYKTYSQWEIDAVFVAWLINRHVEKDSEFIIVEKGVFIESEYAINTPNSRFRRGGKETAFESALRQLNIHTSCTDSLTPIIRIIELAPWRKSEYIHVLTFESDIFTLLKKQDISAVFSYIDEYCKGEKK